MSFPRYPKYKASGVEWLGDVPEGWTPYEGHHSPQVTPQVTPQVAMLLSKLTGEHTRSELQEMLGLLDREHFRKVYLQPAFDLGLLERTIPDKPNSRLQKYRLTLKGRTWLAQQIKKDQLEKDQKS